MNAPRAQNRTVPADTREVADPEEIDRPDAPEDGDNPDTRARAAEHGRWRTPGSLGWLGPDE